MKKYVISILIVAALAVLAVSSYSLTGVFTKAFDKTLSPGEQYERNITIRKYYDLTVRFQKESSSSYLSFDSNETIVTLKDADGNEIASNGMAVNGKIYFMLDRSQLDRIMKVSVFNLGSYSDVEEQGVNITYSGTNAYITVKVSFKPATISGYIIDELTNQTVEGVDVYAFPNDSNPYTTEPLAQNVSTSDGRYELTMQLTTSKSLDIHVKGYDVS